MMKKLFISRDLVSYSNQGQSVVPEIVAATPATLSLVFGAAVIWVVVAISMGVAAAVLKGSVFDPLLMILALIGISMPVFWLGEVLNLLTQHAVPRLVPLQLGAAASATRRSRRIRSCGSRAWSSRGSRCRCSTSASTPGCCARACSRSQNEDYVRTARAKGISERRVLVRHTLRTSMITFVSLFGLDFGALVAGGVLLTEVVFGIHGVGFLTYQSLTNLDLPAIMATVVYGAFFIVLANTLVDIAYAWLDPRIRLA